MEKDTEKKIAELSKVLSPEERTKFKGLLMKPDRSLELMASLLWEQASLPSRLQAEVIEKLTPDKPLMEMTVSELLEKLVSSMSVTAMTLGREKPVSEIRAMFIASIHEHLRRLYGDQYLGDEFLDSYGDDVFNHPKLFDSL